MISVDQFIDQAVSVPFKVGGRDWSGWDCYGLIFVAYQELFDVQIAKLSDQYDDQSTFGELNDLVNIQRSVWKTVEIPIYGDVRLFKVSRYQTHTALVLPGKRMIHATEGVGTAIERLDVIQWAKRHVEYFRHKTHFDPGGTSPAQN